MQDTYLQPSELIVRWPDGGEFSSAQISASIADSYSLVNSYLNSNLKLPVMEADGDIPAILRQCQLEFAKHILLSNDQGESDDLQQRYERNADRLSKITQNELLISEVAKTQLDVGWTIIENNFTSGSAYVRGDPPTVDMSYTFTVTSAGKVYAPSATFSVVRSDSSSTFVTFTGTFLSWTPIGNGLEVRFDGQFLQNETFIVKGVAGGGNIVSSHDVIRQSPLIF